MQKTITSCVQLTDVTPQRELRNSPVTHNAAFSEAVLRPLANLQKHTVNRVLKSGGRNRRGRLSRELKQSQKASLAADTHRVFPYAQQAVGRVSTTTASVHQKKKKTPKQRGYDVISWTGRSSLRTNALSWEMTPWSRTPTPHALKRRKKLLTVWILVFWQKTKFVKNLNIYRHFVSTTRETEKY